ncbi:hypothetical protein IKMOJFFE_00015 [Vaccinia virus]|uniref:Uncharacterized protein n=1 Tax=Vaccinia virus TaxID=10245 RepID=A0A7G4P1G9_VACCV|nr:hypothetical protein IKMOJFFE_00015 [Vaccinia virus]
MCVILRWLAYSIVACGIYKLMIVKLVPNM